MWRATTGGVVHWSGPTSTLFDGHVLMNLGVVVLLVSSPSVSGHDVFCALVYVVFVFAL
jgi:hypothetical protein